MRVDWLDLIETTTGISPPQPGEGGEIGNAGQPSLAKRVAPKEMLDADESDPGAPQQVSVAGRVADEEEPVRREAVAADEQLDLAILSEALTFLARAGVRRYLSSEVDPGVVEVEWRSSASVVP